MDITFDHVSFTYQAGTPFAGDGIKDVSGTIHDGSYTAIIGHTGSGKSTILQHLNALLKPTSGTVTIGDKVITNETSNKNLKPLRQKVGMVFQFAENQLFEQTVAKDIAFGPQNFGVSEQDALALADKMITMVGLPHDVLEKSPFDLSGGQMRRVAIAGVLAMQPEVLVLDEPTAGLDPQGASDMMRLFVDMNKKYGKNVLIVTHDMEHVLQYCEEVVVVQDGSIKKHCDVQSFFETVELLQELNINPPAVIRLREELIRRGFSIDRTLLDMDKLAAAIACEVKKHE